MLASILALINTNKQKRALEEMRTAQQERDSLINLQTYSCTRMYAKRADTKKIRIIFTKIKCKPLKKKIYTNNKHFLSKEEKNLHTKEQEYGLLLLNKKQHTQTHTALLQEGQAIA